MVRQIDFEVVHSKGERIELYYHKQRHRFHLQPDKTSSKFCLIVDGNIDEICIRQYHPLNTIYWWKYILLPIAFLQGFLLRYERKYVDDYFAQIRFKVINNNCGCVKLELVKAYTGEMVNKNFYANLRKDGYLTGKEQFYNYSFKILNCQNCSTLQVVKNMKVDRMFTVKWRIVRIVPAVFSYGLLVVGVQCYINQCISRSGLTWNTLILFTPIVILLYLIVSDIKKIMSFHSKYDGAPWKEY